MEEIKQVDINGRVYDLQDETARKDNVYSTTEIDTGKKWINGKPIYRKVFTQNTWGTATDDWRNTGITIENVEQLISVTPMRRSNKGLLVLGSYKMNGNALQYYFPFGYSSDPRIDCTIVEYTKN